MEEDQVDLTVLFEISPDKFPWRVPVPRQIEDRRARMSDVLIFDILLSAGGVKHPHTLYPPRDLDSLRRLLDAIEDTTYDALKKDCLIYFLLKWHQDGREDKFQEDRCIPPQFVALADAYWHLDSGIDVPRAVSLLSDARLNRDYPSKILQALSLEENANELILRYVRTAKPLLTEPDDLDVYSIALAESSLLAAWHYQRTFPEGGPMRSRIIHNIFRWCLTPKPRAKPLVKLLAFPLSRYEQSLLEDYALSPPLDLPIPSIPALQDLACTRLIQGGELAAAVKLDRRFAITPIRGTFTNKLNDHARKIAADRKQIIDEIMAVMPVAERMLLEAELEQMGQEGDNASKTPDTRSPRVNGDAKRGPRRMVVDPPILPIPQRSGAPRFGGPVPANASSSFAAIRQMYEAISAGKPLPHQGGSPKPLAQEDTDPIIESQDAPSTGVKPGESGETATSISARKSSSKSPNRAANSTPTSAPPRQSSLFASKGSANRAPNAFFTPTSAAGPSVGSKRPRPEEHSPRRSTTHPAKSSTAPALAPTAEEPEEDGDVDMQEIPPEAEHGEDISAEPPLGQKSRAGYTTSVFSAGEDIDMDLRARGSASYKSSSASATPAPPGAFAAEAEEADEPEPSTPPRAQPSPPPASRIPARRQPTRVSRAQSSAADLARSVPGAFVDEEEDTVPPLPSTRPPRRRASRAVDETPRTTRRSSRLAMSASERGSSSPEPEPAPAKTKRSSARTPATPSKSRARKQR
ncbi:ELYS domain-containing protein [Phanerochaete sordida]|uniref:ELYS domain-containing protein n=1 Tax=Phanerochaete sordida TaxID=48140 RepID=A0A9P3GFS8_9APHY|nr:ELYS domain-containing protein [Phanerochaete sordida]